MTRVILEEIFSSLSDYKSQDNLLVKCELEVVSLASSIQLVATPQRIGILKTVLQDTQLIQSGGLVSHTLCALMQVGGFEGLKEAIEIAERDEVTGLQA